VIARAGDWVWILVTDYPEYPHQIREGSPSPCKPRSVPLGIMLANVASQARRPYEASHHPKSHLHQRLGVCPEYTLRRAEFGVLLTIVCALVTPAVSTMVLWLIAHTPDMDMLRLALIVMGLLALWMMAKGMRDV